MSHDLKADIAAILQEGRDITLATVRPDGSPQATTVSYATDGRIIYFGCSPTSQKAANLARDPRISATVNLPYKDWAQIRGLSLFGRARPVTDPDEVARVGLLFMERFPEIAQYAEMAEAPTLFALTPEIVSILDYRQGFGHTDLVEIPATAA